MQTTDNKPILIKIAVTRKQRKEIQMRPYDVTDTEQFLTMESDNFPGDPAKWAILHSGDHVTLFTPANDMGSQMFSIPREEFNAIVDWYLAEQKTVKAPA